MERSGNSNSKLKLVISLVVSVILWFEDVQKKVCLISSSDPDDKRLELLLCQRFQKMCTVKKYESSRGVSQCMSSAFAEIVDNYLGVGLI